MAIWKPKDTHYNDGFGLTITNHNSWTAGGAHKTRVDGENLAGAVYLIHWGTGAEQRLTSPNPIYNEQFGKSVKFHPRLRKLFVGALGSSTFYTYTYHAATGKWLVDIDN